MAAVTSTRRQREEEHFRLHQDAPSTQDTEMSEEAEQQHHYGNAGRHDAHNVDEHEQHDDEEEEEQRQAGEEVEASSATEGEGEQQEDQHEDEDDDQDSVSSDSSDDDVVDPNIQDDMEKLQNTFPNFRQQYRLIKRIGEGLNHQDQDPLSPATKLTTSLFQAPFRPFTKPKTSSTISTIIRGTTNKKVTSGRLPLSGHTDAARAPV